MIFSRMQPVYKAHAAQKKSFPEEGWSYAVRGAVSGLFRLGNGFLRAQMQTDNLAAVGFAHGREP